MLDATSMPDPNLPSIPSEDSLAPDDAWLTTEQAAEEFGFHRETLRKWIREGTITASRAPGRRRWRIRRSDLASALQERERSQPAVSSATASAGLAIAGERTVMTGR